MVEEFPEFSRFSLIFPKGPFSRFSRFSRFSLSCKNPVIFFPTLLGLPEFYEFLHFLFLFMLSFWKTFPDILNYASTSNSQEDMMFYNLGDKSFDTDLSIAQLNVFHAIYD